MSDVAARAERIVALPAGYDQCSVCDQVQPPISWPDISFHKSVTWIPELSFSNLFGGLVFGSIGFVAFIYGKRMHIWKAMLLGIGLMVYPYFVANTVAIYAIGLAGTITLLFLRN